MPQHAATARTAAPQSLAPHRVHLSGLALVMAAAALWATVGVASQLVPKEMQVPGEAYGFARTALAGPALLLVGLATGARGALHKDPWGFLTFGICCAVFQIGLFRSFSLLGVTVTVFLTVCLPPVIAVGWALLRNPASISRGVMTALLIAVAGLAAFSSSGFSDGHFTQIFWGLALSLAASVAFVVMSNTARSLAERHDPLLVAGIGLSVTSVVLAAALSLMAPQGWSQLAAGLSDWKISGLLLYLGLVPTALAYLLYCRGMALCRSAPCGLVASTIEPGVAAVLAFLVLNESLSPWQALGCVLMLVAMVTLWLEGQQEKTKT